MGDFFTGIIIFFIGVGMLYLIIKHISKEEEEERKRVSALSVEQQKAYYEDRKIDYTIIVAEDSKKSVGSAVVRGAIGGAVLGPAGMLGGTLSGKNKTKTTFTVVYKSGRREVVTVDNDSDQFKEYAKYIR